MPPLALTPGQKVHVHPLICLSLGCEVAYCVHSPDAIRTLDQKASLASSSLRLQSRSASLGSLAYSRASQT